MLDLNSEFATETSIQHGRRTIELLCEPIELQRQAETKDQVPPLTQRDHHDNEVRGLSTTERNRDLERRTYRAYDSLRN